MIKTEEELKKLVEDLHIKAKAGLQPEFLKTELKGTWYNLDRSQNGTEYKINVSKFLKAITSLANTYGLSGYLVIGIDEKTGAITNSPFINSGLKDRTELYGLVVKNVDKPITYENHEIETDIDGTKKTITVIVVPPSLDKPHVIGNYVTKGQEIQNFIPVKKDTGTFAASRTDIDLMYYDNKNIIPEYAVSIKTFKGSEIMIQPAGASVSIDFPVIFENYGRKPVILIKCDFFVDEVDGQEQEPMLKFELGAYSLSDNSNTRSEVKRRPIIIPNGAAIVYTCHFFSWEKILYDKVKSGKIVGAFVAWDAFGNKYESSIFRTGV